jgi:hypothetical protein
MQKERFSSSVWYDGKRFEICMADLEFEPGHVFLVKTWNSRDFTNSSGLRKYVFPGGFLQIQN